MPIRRSLTYIATATKNLRNKLHNTCKKWSTTRIPTLRDIILLPVELIVTLIEGSATDISENMGVKNETGYSFLADANSDEATKTKLKRRIVKNLIVLTFVFILIFVAYNGLSSLQSVLFPDHSLGTLCQGITYLSYLVSSLFLPRLFIVKFGQKWTIIICIVGYMTWMAANGFADWYTLGITSAIVGLCAGPLWTSQASYVTKYATLYAKLTGEEPQHKIAHFFGIFGAIFGTSKILSSLSAAYILSPGHNSSTILYSPTEEDLLQCGRNDCPRPSNESTTNHNHNFQKIDDVVLWTLVTVYLITALVAILLAAFLLDPVPDELQDKVKDTSTIWRETLELLTATVRLLGRPELLLMIPLIMTPGMDFAFFNADWSRSYITCAVGISYVGWTTFPQGAIGIPVQLIGGMLVKPLGRMPLIITGVMLLILVNVIQFVWMPRPDSMWVFFLVSSLYGLSGIGGPAKEALIGTEFHDCMDATFSNIHVWGSLGGSMAFAYSTYLCISTKLTILIIFLSLGILGYIGAELVFRRGGQGVGVSIDSSAAGEDMEEFPLMDAEEQDDDDDEEKEEEGAGGEDQDRDGGTEEEIPWDENNKEWNSV